MEFEMLKVGEHLNTHCPALGLALVPCGRVRATSSVLLMWDHSHAKGD